MYWWSHWSSMNSVDWRWHVNEWNMRSNVVQWSVGSVVNAWDVWANMNSWDMGTYVNWWSIWSNMYGWSVRRNISGMIMMSTSIAVS